MVNNIINIIDIKNGDSSIEQIFLVSVCIIDKNRLSVHVGKYEVNFFQFIGIERNRAVLVWNGYKPRITQVTETSVCIVPCVAFLCSQELFQALVCRFPCLCLSCVYVIGISLQKRVCPLFINKFLILPLMFFFFSSEVKNCVLYCIILPVVDQHKGKDFQFIKRKTF